ncbi:NAD(P)/FAD-dependent oxidoreductase [Spartinivicinus poritis]|uniref:NAD(P)/FAD-dependent oxidoreductase n=1 Tax=Spartinivicinus poritis TaxID=2994640 RepID=A0ABT5U390_9GAMM|nr:NAD(P)/FAD-dependent oxidoreductase [Spartinivicinus sp. A2-2]MDE1460835.1 NAD(P)/FAD-dependent oxidoreductase [Spartinivicinus sp. A2-2]
MRFNRFSHTAPDVLVVGAGPAGCCTALVLSLQGYQVIVIDRAKDESVKAKIGECLPPRGLACLKKLGLAQRFHSDDHLKMVGYRVSWDAKGGYDRDFLANPSGGGWIVNRARFDHMLVSAAEQQGVQFYWNTKLTALCTTSDEYQRLGYWKAYCEINGCEQEILPKILVDASGRSRAIAKRLDRKTRRLDGLVASIMRIKHTNKSTLPPHTVLIENTSQGWWYTAPVSDKCSVLCYFTDGDLPLPKSTEKMLALAKQNPELCQRLSHCVIDSNHTLQRTAAYSSALDQCAGEGWLAVGDAACSYDPLSSFGILSGIGSGYYGACAISAESKGKTGQLAAYQQLMQENFLCFIDIHQAEYKKVTQFQSDFWLRRQNSD